MSCVPHAVATAFRLANGTNQTRAITAAVGAASSQAATANTTAAGQALAAAAVQSVTQGVPGLFAASQASPHALC